MTTTHADADAVAAARLHADHAAVLDSVHPLVVGWRGCVGVALILDGEAAAPAGEGTTGMAFVPNDRLTWVTGVDVPVPWISGQARPSHLMQVRRAALRYGAPILDQTTVTSEFDYWDGPTRRLRPDLVLAFNGINAAMTSTAFAYRKDWRPYRAGRWAEFARTPAGRVILGGRDYEAAIVKDYGWIPHPWVDVDPRRAGTAFERLKKLGYTTTFREIAADLFVAGMLVVAPVEGYFTGTSPLVADGVKYTQFNFRDAGGGRHAVVATAKARVTSQKGLPVFRGTQVGADGPPVPPGFTDWSRDRQWGELTRAYTPGALELVLGNTFSAMFRRVGGRWLLPYEAIGADVSYSFSEGGLWWEVSGIAVNDFSLAGDGRIHIMPTVRMEAWDDFKMN